MYKADLLRNLLCYPIKVGNYNFVEMALYCFGIAVRSFVSECVSGCNSSVYPCLSECLTVTVVQFCLS